MLHRIQFIILLSVCMASCSTSKEEEKDTALVNYLNFKKIRLDGFVAGNGNLTRDVRFKAELDKVLGLMDSIQFDEVIGSVQVREDRKNDLVELYNSSAEKDINVIKLAFVDAYYNEILDGYYFFDKVEPVVVNKGNDDLFFYLHASSSAIIPNLFKVEGDSMQKLEYNSNRPISVNLSNLVFDSLYDQIPVTVKDKADFIYMIPTRYGDKSMGISLEEDIK
ncbi:hypothetical protein R9C00_17715 [Flammeovirgaceae bacterium SG7u.111]|nr:hypothetical protein [Flammeovirgaceae bacterium SG7u.132]WPO33541.1 hypothetical protein R9C00_17715 [Flammeovirgaceae bacterium SG7u.111]